MRTLGVSAGDADKWKFNFCWVNSRVWRSFANWRIHLNWIVIITCFGTWATFFGTSTGYFLKRFPPPSTPVFASLPRASAVGMMAPSAREKRPALERGSLLALLCGFLCLVAARACPHKCSCSGSHVDCQAQGFKSLPRGIPRNTERLWVAHGTHITDSLIAPAHPYRYYTNLCFLFTLRKIIKQPPLLQSRINSLKYIHTVYVSVKALYSLHTTLEFYCYSCIETRTKSYT